jgi:REP element-mobilizing transposase RayT
MPRVLRKRLDHTTHFAGRFGAIYFISVCCQQRRSNQLCNEDTSKILFDTARIYHESGRWNLSLLLLMPDHLHGLIGVDGRDSLSQLLRDYKRITAKLAGIHCSEIFSIIAFAMTKVWLRSLPISAGTRYAPGWFETNNIGPTFSFQVGAIDLIAKVAAIDLNRLGGSGEPPLPGKSMPHKTKTPRRDFQRGALNLSP